MENRNIICPVFNTSKDSGNNECPDCGYVFTETEKSNNEEGSLKKRHPILAMFLQFLTPGLGHLYNGQIRKAIVIFLISLFGGVFLFPASISTFNGLILFLAVGLAFVLYIMIDALYSSIKLKRIKIRAYNKWYIYLIIIIVNAIIGNFYPVIESYQAFKIPAGSMKPTLLIGDHIIVDKQAYSNEKPLRGDVVVFQWPKDESKAYIKRIVGIEGDKVQIVKGALYINDEIVKTRSLGKFSDDSILQADVYEEIIGENRHSILDQIKNSEDFGPVTVPEHSIFVLGDNRDNSMDSRYWGFVSLNKIIGKPLYVYWARDKNRLGLQIN